MGENSSIREVGAHGVEELAAVELGSMGEWLEMGGGHDGPTAGFKFMLKACRPHEGL